jgi:hypothetical protein
MHGDVERKTRDAIALHSDGLPETSQPIPEPSELATASVKVTRQRHSTCRLALVATACGA